MKRKTEIEVEIDPSGEVHFEVKGIKGKGCMEYVEVFKRLLGKVIDEKRTSEYYAKEGHVSGEVEGKVRK